MNGKSRRIADFLEHILAAIDPIRRYTVDMDFDGFVASEITQDAVIRNFEIIGEACRNIGRIDPGFAARHPKLPLRAATEMRNALAHDYFGAA